MVPIVRRSKVTGWPRYRYTLPDELYEECMNEAAQRALDNQARGSKNENAQRTGTDPDVAETMGALTEMVAALHLGQWPGFRLGRPDDGKDLAYEGHRYNVKSVQWRFLDAPILYGGSWLSKCERYLLTVVDIPHGVVELVGWATHETLYDRYPDQRGKPYGRDPESRWIHERQLDGPIPPPHEWGRLLTAGWTPRRERSLHGWTVVWYPPLPARI